MLVDIDHTPATTCIPATPPSTPAGLAHLGAQIAPGGVFALWSDDPPDNAFLKLRQGAFASCDAHLVTFPNPHTGGEASNTVSVAATD